MRLKVDKNAGAAYLYLVGDGPRPGASKKTLPVGGYDHAGGIYLDFDAEGRIIGIEILNLDLLPRELLKEGT